MKHLEDYAGRLGELMSLYSSLQVIFYLCQTKLRTVDQKVLPDISSRNFRPQRF